MRFLILLGLLAFLGCKVEPLFEIPSSFEEVILFEEQAISSGAIFASLSLTPPDVLIDFPSEETTPLPGGNESPGRDADLHIDVLLQYAVDGVQGGNKAGDFVPYLLVEAELENLETGENARITLSPHISLQKGFHYGRNIELESTLGLSESGYQVTLLILPPALVSDPVFPEEALGRSALSPGISIGTDLSTFLAGTLFSLRGASTRALDTIELRSVFTLADLLGEDTGNTGGVVGYSY